MRYWFFYKNLILHLIFSRYCIYALYYCFISFLSICVRNHHIFSSPGDTYSDDYIWKTYVYADILLFYLFVDISRIFYTYRTYPSICNTQLVLDIFYRKFYELLHSASIFWVLYRKKILRSKRRTGGILRETRRRKK